MTMKVKQNIIKAAWLLAVPTTCLVASCNYLDVIPPAQADFDDTMKDESATLDFLYSCYSYIAYTMPVAGSTIETSSDEIVQPRMWNDYPQNMAWGTISAANCSGGGDAEIWTTSYNQLGQVHRFEQLLGQLHPTGVTEEEKDEYRAEAAFCDAYYPVLLLRK